ncbi:helix-turn-helix domain-containing protein [Marinirhabdus gelatinilytica]|uniref:Helix-turn-helix protein n=1 Tax=Marinirhabdus gelatinilytica TaxID=1703343 RepID=A0A370QAG0_9FLAO|nr:helix-turn-helix transcriptional regulator [Marinirhabdus gelatinilytica]RDK85365.1 helix-turn-helix protein [Marinirhabdus gelatinilytica]
MVNSADFSKRLEKILDYYGLSATAFSEKIDFNRSTISHLISGRNKPSLEFVMKVVQTFEEVNLYWLLNGKGSFPSTPKIETVTPQKETPENTGAPKTEVPKVEHGILPSSNSGSNSIDRIVIFYADGTFKEYLP